MSGLRKRPLRRVRPVSQSATGDISEAEQRLIWGHMR